MPQTDILNRTPGYDPDLGDTMNPNYGFTRKRPITRGIKKAIGGTPYTRETSNTGHQFTFSWLNRTLACVRKLKWYYEQYEDGFFTIVDYDGGGRHYVGRFTTEVSPVETANGRWDVQNVSFEEIPQCPMLQYPNDWDNDAIRFYPFNDFGDQKLATSGTWAATARGAGCDAYTTMDDAGATVGDSATYEYRGYGFRLWMLTGPNYGQVSVFLDGTPVGNPLASSGVTGVDLYQPVATDPVMVLVEEAVPLDFHRVEVVITGSKNAGSSGTGMSWAFLDVMR